MASQPKARPGFKLAPIPALLAVALVLPGLAFAADDDQSTTQEKVIVTGTNIRRVDSETPSPVQVISSEDLKKSGYTSVAQVLQGITANGQGTLNQGFSQAFAGGASGISLRGLTTAYTLVLIDGHRMAPYPLSDDGQRQFVDVSNIPFDAVERIEILKDGASAVYGSDAIAGVVNIILKHSFVGDTITAEYGAPTEGAGKTTHASISHGWGDLDVDGYNAYLNVEYRHQDPIYYGDRAGDGLWQSLNYTGLGGLNKTPGVVNPFNPQPPTYNQPYLTIPGSTYSAATSYFYPGKCNYNLQQAGGCAYQNPYAELEPRTQNTNILGSFTKALENGWKLNIQASVFDSQGEQYPAGGLFTFPTGFGGNVGVASGVLPFVVGTPISEILLPANYPGNGLHQAAFLNGTIPGAPDPHTEYDSTSQRFVADLSGTLGAWDIDANIGHTQVQTMQSVLGTMDIPAFNTAINATPGTPGFFSITGGNSQKLLNNIFPDTYAEDVSYLDFAELHASRDLMQLAGGAMGLSTGISYVDRTMHSPAPNLIANGIVSGNNAYVSGSQQNTAAFAELVAPVLKSLELDGSVRYDYFDNGLAAWTGKLGFKFTPIDAISFRGSFGSGFRAPNAAENGQSGESYLALTTFDPVLCPGGNAAAKGAVIAFCNYSPVTLQSSNPDLQPEHSLSGTLGMIFQPIKNWSSTFDLYSTEIKDQIVTGPISPNPVLSAPISELCSNGAGGTYNCTVPTPLYYPASYVNANSVSTTGWELTSAYRLPLGDVGTFKFAFDWSHTMGYILKLDGVNYQLAGTHGPFVIGGDTGNPRDKIQTSVDWARGPVDVRFAVNYISSFNLTDPSYGLDDCAAGASAVGNFPFGPPPSQYCKVDSFTTADVSAHYQFDKHWTLFGSITNLFNKQPPVDFNTYGGGQLPFNPSFHEAGAVGRFVDVGATYTF